MVERSLRGILVAADAVHHKILEVIHTHPPSSGTLALRSAGFGLFEYLQGAKETYETAMDTVTGSIAHRIARLPQNTSEMQLGTLPHELEQGMLSKIADRASHKVSNILLLTEEHGIHGMELTLHESLRQLSEIAHPGKGSTFRG